MNPFDRRLRGKAVAVGSRKGTTMITDPNLHWWAVFGLRLIAGIMLATAAILLLDLAAHTYAA